MIADEAGSAGHESGHLTCLIGNIVARLGKGGGKLNPWSVLCRHRPAPADR
jgi:hypothetical protein